MFIVVIASMMLYYTTNRPIGVVHHMAFPFEANIPLLKEFVVIYHTCYPFMFINLVLFMLSNKALLVESAASIALGNVLAFFTYLIYQTEVPRPEISGNDLFSQLLGLTYRMDKPFIGFPSQHVLITTIILIAILRSKSNKGYKIFLIIRSTAIFLSTLFIKQHTLLDIAGVVVYGFASYIIVAVAIELNRKKGIYRSEL